MDFKQNIVNENFDFIFVHFKPPKRYWYKRFPVHNIDMLKSTLGNKESVRVGVHVYKSYWALCVHVNRGDIRTSVFDSLYRLMLCNHSVLGTR